MEQVTGLEPVISAWKANVLPLHYTCLFGFAVVALCVVTGLFAQTVRRLCFAAYTFRLRRFIRRNGSPGTGGFSVLFAARESEGREAKSGYPVKKLVV